METTVQTSLGCFRVQEADGAIVGIVWGSGDRMDTPLLREAARQLRAYDDRHLRRFDLPLAPAGTPFQRSVWASMLEIPYGEIRTYGDLARALDALPQPVGAACGANPLPIIIPCHRVIAAGGNLGGYSGGRGLETKRALLVHEGALAEQFSLF